MSIEVMKSIKEQLLSCIQGQLGDLKNVDAEELGEAIDMVKDLSEAIYHCTITEAMEKADESKEMMPVNNINYYTHPMYNKMTYPEYRDMERNGGYMYYPSSPGGNTSSGSNGSSSGGRTSNSGGNSTSYYTEMLERDPKEGRSAMRRRMYMEGKEMNNDLKSQLKELQAYLQELSNDITEMVKDASPEERAVLHQKMTTLAGKIA